jgi:hypothetical protein
MNTTAPPPELQTLEKLREEELEQASAIQSMMMHRRASPARVLARFSPLSRILPAGAA